VSTRDQVDVIDVVEFGCDFGSEQPASTASHSLQNNCSVFLVNNLHHTTNNIVRHWTYKSTHTDTHIFNIIWRATRTST
jgi:hypothetical protein